MDLHTSELPTHHLKHNICFPVILSLPFTLADSLLKEFRFQGDSEMRFTGGRQYAG